MPAAPAFIAPCFGRGKAGHNEEDREQNGLVDEIEKKAVSSSPGEGMRRQPVRPPLREGRLRERTPKEPRQRQSEKDYTRPRRKRSPIERSVVFLQTLLAYWNLKSRLINMSGGEIVGRSSFHLTSVLLTRRAPNPSWLCWCAFEFGLDTLSVRT